MRFFFPIFKPIELEVDMNDFCIFSALQSSILSNLISRTGDKSVFPHSSRSKRHFQPVLHLSDNNGMFDEK